ncbi:GNAT family N-acetyltransferase [Catellatospora sichuanensis]|uniref:GNAT family N-acetyltransferase n=1 Tax=Catellatospora sichuanensis TaxID=1969805 RepID=UPI001182C2BF|nr:GNAT family N-acetyltransferase [Catellatospora sichuanensis]
MPLRSENGDTVTTLLHADDGTPLARLRLRDDDGTLLAERVRPLPGADLAQVAAQARRDLAGRRLTTPDDALARALVDGGLRLRRAATEMHHDLAGLPPLPPTPAGWSLRPGGWDDDLAEGLSAAYGPEHPDGRWQDSDTTQIKSMFEHGDPVPPLAEASARVADPDGRSAGHVLCAGPVPWTEDDCAWILNLGVAPRAQGLGLGRVLLLHAMHGSRAVGLPRLGLEVADGNHARRLYDSVGFQVRARVLSVDLPALD